jgi:hypothetical protein
MNAQMNMREELHAEAMRLPIATLSERLQDTLGQQITAYAVGLKDPRAIGKYARGEVKKPAHATTSRLRNLYVITQILLTRETPETIRAWMIGANPLLEDRPPVLLLHEEDDQTVEGAAQITAGSPFAKATGFPPVALAAEAFITAA